MTAVTNIQIPSLNKPLLYITRGRHRRSRSSSLEASLEQVVLELSEEIFPEDSYNELKMQSFSAGRWSISYTNVR